MQPTPVTVAAAAAEAAAATTGVARLDGGPLGSVATYGGGRRVAGVRVRDGDEPAVYVHVVVALDRPIPLVTEDVRDAVVGALERIGDVGRAVHIHVTDIDTSLAEAADPREPPPGT